MSIFVDTSAWYAAADRGDRHNQRAKLLLATASEPLVTSDHVLVESWRLIHHSISARAGETFWDGLRRGVASVEQTGASDLEAAWAIGRRFPDQDFSLVDRTSFSLMQRLGISKVITFAHDFAVFRYGRDLRLAFDVLR
ncbi:MAG: PIN domain-containing protein [bacterium]|nr:PIN domain-containing protein [bacterium]MDE0287156.1 PIN domain-containing protein [bacterium]MDE0437499.1 PIN domain-containing protein [bacterium]